jgi:hypothetical protein
MQLETLRNAKSLDPKDFAVCGGGHQPLVTLRFRDPGIGEQILKLDGARHADRSEAIPASPMPEDDSVSDGVGIESFEAGRFPNRRHAFNRFSPPGCLGPVESNAFGYLEVNFDSALLKLRPGAGSNKSPRPITVHELVATD